MLPKVIHKLQQQHINCSKLAPLAFASPAEWRYGDTLHEREKKKKKGNSWADRRGMWDGWIGWIDGLDGRTDGWMDI